VLFSHPVRLRVVVFRHNLSYWKDTMSSSQKVLTEAYREFLKDGSSSYTKLVTPPPHHIKDSPIKIYNFYFEQFFIQRIFKEM
jgi:hypothetical protein